MDERSAADRDERRRRYGPGLVIAFGLLTILGCIDAVIGAVQRNALLLAVGIALAGGGFFAYRTWREIVRRLGPPR